MSTKNNLELAAEDEVCACCGIAAIDDIKLKLCDGGCGLVKYCSDDCQDLHRPEHIGVCRKRKEEMHDKDLFSQPDGSYHGDCPICCLPLPIHASKSTMMPCCSKLICIGCDYANQKREAEAGLEHRCAFCREPAPKSKEEGIKNIVNRIEEHDDPVAMTHMGRTHYHKRDFGKALEYWTKAAELGHVDAHCCLGDLYYNGNGVEKDEKKAVYHLEQAAIGGHPQARHHLALDEMKNIMLERAAKHHIIAANQGHDVSLKLLKDFFVQGVVSKEDYAAALRGYQAAVGATKSAEREEAEAYFKKHARR